MLQDDEKLASCVDKGDVKGATVAQNKMIRVFHGVYGIELSDIWNGQKYALQQLGLIATPFTIAQEMDSLTDAVKQRIEKCLADMKDELD